MPRILLALICLAVAACAIGQKKDSFAKERPKLGPPTEMARLNWMLGYWDAIPGKAEPGGFWCEPALGGRHLRITYFAAGKEPQSMTLLTFDQEKEVYRAREFSSSSAEMDATVGELRDGGLVLMTEGDADTVYRVTFRRSPVGGLIYRLEQKSGDAAWKALFRGEYTKAK